MFVLLDNYMGHKVFLLLGSNLGDRSANLESAIHHIEKRVGTVVKRSSLYETSAWGKTDQPDFYNVVVSVNTSLTPQDVLHVILGIEKEMGRRRIIKWGERLIDIDILLYNDLVLETSELTIPHPQMIYRRFTLAPLAEIAPEIIHPVRGKKIISLLDECPDPLPVTRL